MNSMSLNCEFVIYELLVCVSLAGVDRLNLVLLDFGSGDLLNYKDGSCLSGTKGI